jgi:hypothetical protein
MPIGKERALDYLEHEWGTYVDRFHRLPPEEQTQRLKKTGYESLRDLLAHILAWWEEGMGIILAIAEDRPFERKKYDFDAFNADAVAKYSSWDEAEFMTHFEATRQKMDADLKLLNDPAFENRRVKAWLRAVLLAHAREHLITLSRFLVLDMLQNDWATYVDDFHRLEPKNKRSSCRNRALRTSTICSHTSWAGGRRGRVLLMASWTVPRSPGRTTMLIPLTVN